MVSTALLPNATNSIPDYLLIKREIQNNLGIYSMLDYVYGNDMDTKFCMWRAFKDNNPEKIQELWNAYENKKRSS